MTGIHRRCLAAGIVLAGGLVAALPFYRVTSPHPSATRTTDRPTSSPAATAAIPEPIPDLMPTTRRVAARVTTEEPEGTKLTDARFVTKSPPPGSPVELDSLAAAGSDSQTSASPEYFTALHERTEVSAKSSSGPWNAPPLAPQQPSAAEPVPPIEPIPAPHVAQLQDAWPKQPDESRPRRVHRIIDGDTLEVLAEKYLGHRSRWPEIRAANPQILADRDILPIGSVLQIPHAAAQEPSLVPIPPR